ncbi:hypothetical protein JCM17380_52170 [Desulfosporosinus burensis]
MGGNTAPMISMVFYLWLLDSNSWLFTPMELIGRWHRGYGKEIADGKALYVGLSGT